MFMKWFLLMDDGKFVEMKADDMNNWIEEHAAKFAVSSTIHYNKESNTIMIYVER